VQLQDKVALVTGGTRGSADVSPRPICARAGVAINGRSRDKGDQALAEFGAGDGAIFLADDVMSQAELNGVVDRTVRHFGRLDILVNNAGGSCDNANVANASPESFENVLRWNVLSTFWATKRGLHHVIPSNLAASSTCPPSRASTASRGPPPR